jgi:hypothetical protein
MGWHAPAGRRAHGRTYRIFQTSDIVPLDVGLFGQNDARQGPANLFGIFVQLFFGFGVRNIAALGGLVGRGVLVVVVAMGGFVFFPIQLCLEIFGTLKVVVHPCQEEFFAGVVAFVLDCQGEAREGVAVQPQGLGGVAGVVRRHGLFHQVDGLFRQVGVVHTDMVVVWYGVPAMRSFQLPI